MTGEPAPRNEIHAHHAGVMTRGQPEPCRFGRGPLRAKGQAMNIEIERNDGYDVLECPHCGSEWLHHDAVQVFVRQEDAETGMHAQVHGELFHVSTNLDGCPSSRRGGVVITFWCETCKSVSLLGIAQHKGTTHLKWMAQA